MKQSLPSSPSPPHQRLRYASSELHRSELRVQPKPATAYQQEPGRHGEDAVDVTDGGGAAAAAASAPSGRVNLAAATSCQGSGAPTKERAGGDATTGRGAAAHGHIDEPLQSVKAIKKPTPPSNPPPENKNKDKIHPVGPYSAGAGGGRSGAAAKRGGEELMADEVRNPATSGYLDPPPAVVQ